MLGGAAVAVVLEHPREQLLGRLARLEVEPLLAPRAGSISRDFSSSSAAISTRNSVAASRSSSPRALEVLDVGEHDLGEVDLEQVDLLLQHQRQEQVERPVEDLEVEVERRRRTAASSA